MGIAISPERQRIQQILLDNFPNAAFDPVDDSDADLLEFLALAIEQEAAAAKYLKSDLENARVAGLSYKKRYDLTWADLQARNKVLVTCEQELSELRIQLDELTIKYGNLQEEYGKARQRVLLAEQREDALESGPRRLEEWFEENMPAWDRKGQDPVSSAIELLALVRTHVPSVVQAAWESLRPALHILGKYGLPILPKGTIVYGADGKEKS